nr:hypothetical protein TEA_006031 [Ipomoea batatas]GMD97269.1 hypothetical protein TEA_006031 [Ipomoea batatas]
MAIYSSVAEKFSRLSREAFSEAARLSGNIFSIIRLLRPPPPSTVRIVSILSLLITLIQLQFTGKQSSPFEIHPICMTIAVMSLILYLLLREASHWLPSNSPILLGKNHSRKKGFLLIFWITSD